MSDQIEDIASIHPIVSGRSVAIQKRLLLLGYGAYLGYGLVYDASHPERLILGTLAIGALYVVGRRLGATEAPQFEPLFGWIVVFLFFVMPVAGSSPPREPGFVAGAIGSFVAQGAWALHRYPYNATGQATSFLKQPHSTRVVMAALFGTIMAAMLTVVVVGLQLISFAVGSEHVLGSVVRDLVYLAGGYLGGGFIAGAVVGGLAPLIRFPLGAMSIGVPLTAAIYGVVAMAGAQMNILIDGSRIREGIPLAVAAVMLLYIGPVWGLMAKEWIDK